MRITPQIVPPLAPPPPGIQSNYVDPPSLVRPVRIGLIFTTVIAGIVVVLRLVAKFTTPRRLGWDDAACVLGYAALVAHDALCYTELGQANGLHIWDIPSTNITLDYLKRSTAAFDMYCVASFFVKLSLFLLYLHLFRPQPITRYCIWAGIVACATFYAATLIANMVFSMPAPGQPSTLAIWGARSQQNGSKMMQVAVSQGVFGTISDIVLFVIPVLSLSQLQMQRKRKLGIMVLFGTGLLAIAFSIASLVQRVKTLINAGYDSTWGGSLIFVFSTAEMTAGIICSSVPIISALARHTTVLHVLSYFQSLSSSLRSSRSDSTLNSHNKDSGARFTTRSDGPFKRMGDSDSMQELYEAKDGSNIMRTTTFDVEMESLGRK